MQATGISTDILDTLEARAAAGEDVYSDCVSAGVAVTEDEEAQLWKHARIASIIGKRYGKDLIGEYAKAVKKRKSTIYERRQVYDFYPEITRRGLLEDTALVYSHLRTAMRYGLKLHDEIEDALGTALEFLNEVIANDWTVDEADHYRAERTGGGSSLIGTYTATYDYINNTLDLPDGAELTSGKRYTVKVYEGETL